MLYSPISLKIFSYGINLLHDPNWTGMELFDSIKQCVRGRSEPVDLLHKPLERGLPFFFGKCFYEEFFSSERLEYLHGELAIWFLEDLLGFIDYHQLTKTKAKDSLQGFLTKASNHYDTDETDYCYYLDSKEALTDILHIYEKVQSSYRKDFSELQNVYADEFSDRMIHDRQLCYFVSQLLLEIGFDGDQGDGKGPRKWVNRLSWPERVKRIISSRDRGHCSQCKANLVTELEDDIHIDHMIPISLGGCNDIVNLQILCRSCNLKKSSKKGYVNSSIPNYLKRK